MTTASESNPRWRHVAAIAFDSFVVGSFAVIGRESHNLISDPVETLRVAAPFLVALFIAWSIPAVSRRPWSLRAGLMIGAVTAAGGLLLRSLLFGDGISGAFPVVAAAYIIGLMTGIRLVGLLRAGGTE